MWYSIIMWSDPPKGGGRFLFRKFNTNPLWSVFLSHVHEYGPCNDRYFSNQFTVIHIGRLPPRYVYRNSRQAAIPCWHIRCYECVDIGTVHCSSSKSFSRISRKLNPSGGLCCEQTLIRPPVPRRGKTSSPISWKRPLEIEDHGTILMFNVYN